MEEKEKYVTKAEKIEWESAPEFSIKVENVLRINGVDFCVSMVPYPNNALGVKTVELIPLDPTQVINHTPAGILFIEKIRDRL